MNFAEVVRGLMDGDFSRLGPLFEASPDRSPCPIISWYESGLFADEPKALDEAFSCACFNGCAQVVEYFLSKGVNPSGGANTGLNAFHWAANRGQLKVVEILVRNNAPPETRNAYGGTVLGGTVWSAVHEPKPQHVQIIKTLLKAGAQVSAAEYPSGDDRVDEVLRQYGAES
jgi:Ankyrin repeats (3 copies)